MASGTGGFDAKPVAGWAEEHADGHFAHHARVTRMRTRRVPKMKSSLSVAAINKLIRSNCGGLSWPEAALRRLMTLTKAVLRLTSLTDKALETNTGEGLRSAVEGFEGGKSWLKLLCNQPEIRG